MTKKGFGDEVYDDTAGFGKIMAYIGAITATIVGVIMIVAGIILIIHKTKRTASVDAIIPQKGASCFKDTNDADNYNCIVNVNSSIGSSIIKTDGPINYAELTALDKMNVKIFYDPNNPSDVGLTSDNSHVLGWVLLVIAIFMIIGSWLWVWITRKYKMAAAAGGASTIFDMFTGR